MRERALGGDPDGIPYDTDFSFLQLKPDHSNRPLWVTPDNRIFLETFSPIYKQVRTTMNNLKYVKVQPHILPHGQTPLTMYSWHVLAWASVSSLAWIGLFNTLGGDSAVAWSSGGEEAMNIRCCR